MTWVALWALGLAAGASAETGLQVRAAPAVARCVRAAAAAYEASTGTLVSVVAGDARAEGSADVLVAYGAELTRALESGAAVVGSDVDVARVPWVLSVTEGSPRGLRSLDDLAAAGIEVSILAGGTAREARRALEGRTAVREVPGVEGLAAARATLVPLPLAGRGERLAVDLRPLVAGAAVATGAARPDDAGAFVGFLASEAGQRAFAACGDAGPAPSQP